ILSYFSSSSSSPTTTTTLSLHDALPISIIEIHLPGAVVTFRWQFAELPNTATRITQRVTLAGERATDYLAGAAELEKGIPEGMRQLVEEIIKAAQRAPH